jgi:chaperonin cofactor prefoldin
MRYALTKAENVMSEHRIIKRIGTMWRDESRDVVEAALPKRLHELLCRLAALEREDEPDGDGAGRCRPHQPRS